MQELVTAISTVGFPIVMCILIFYYMEKESESHRQEVDGLKEVLTDLKISIVKLTDKIGGGKEVGQAGTKLSI